VQKNYTSRIKIEHTTKIIGKYQILSARAIIPNDGTRRWSTKIKKKHYIYQPLDVQEILLSNKIKAD
jgi:hypothetical protein